MTVKELLLKEIESLPDSLVTEVWELVRELKSKKNLTKIKTPEHLGYSTGFFEEVAGTWEGNLGSTSLLKKTNNLTLFVSC